jgi:23S rRNA (cytidine1920-2'-O)/16S rRNA (cytidine1409-2'-O)-methyltransferase
VVVMERTNARNVESLPEQVNFVAVDVSFISLKLILPSVRNWVMAEADVVALIKPQFEAGPEQVGKGGIVRQPAVRRQVLLDLVRWAETDQWQPLNIIRSPIEGADGNVEYFIWLRPGQGEGEKDWMVLIEQLTKE